MTRTVWLASYPKSGNTWVRSLIHHALHPDDPLEDFSDLQGTRGISSARAPFDACTLLPSGLMKKKEFEQLRPAVHQELEARHTDFGHSLEETDESPFQKTHDAYTHLDTGEPLLGGAGGARMAVLIVRDPRAVAPSLAHFLSLSIDDAIAMMANPKASLANDTRGQNSQLRQRLLTWEGFNASWRDQTDLPVHLVRYEDLTHRPAETLAALLAAVGRPVDLAITRQAAERSRFDRLAALETSKGFGEAPHGVTFFRRGRVDGWQEELTTAQIARIEADQAEGMATFGSLE